MEIGFNCPYCDKENLLEIESMNEYDTWKEICKECNKEFDYTIEYSIEGYTEKIKENESANK